MKIIGLCGLQGAGKDYTAAQLFLEMPRKVSVHRFSTPLKDLLEQLNLPEETKREDDRPRKLMTGFADVIKNTYGQDFFIRTLEETLKTEMAPFVVIPDVRFFMEYYWIKSKGGIIIKIEPSPSNFFEQQCKGHNSEVEWKQFKYDHIIVNPQGLDFEKFINEHLI